MRSWLYFVLAGLIGMNVQAAVQYWDPDTGAGYQHGDGVWSTNAAHLNWGGAAGTGARSAWVNGNDAYLEGSNGSSRIVIDGESVTAGYLRLRTSSYTVVLTNGAFLQTGYNMHAFIGEYNGTSGDTVEIIGGSGAPSKWIQSSLGGLYISGSTVSSNSFGHSLVVDGAGVPESAVFSNNANIFLGYSTGCNSNRVVVRNGGLLYGGQHFNLGVAAGAVGNSLLIDNGSVRIAGRFLIQGTDGAVIVTNGGYLRTTEASHVIGHAGPRNSVTVFSGSQWDCANSSPIILGNVAGCSNNTLTVDGGMVTNVGTLTVGNNVAAPENRVDVIGGGRLFTRGDVVIGSGTGNSVRVAGPLGSLWDAGSKAVTVGSGGNARNNRLVVDGQGVTGGAIVSNLNIFKVGSLSSGNSLLVANGGFLHVVGGDLTVGITGTSNTMEVVGGAGLVSRVEAAGQTLYVGAGLSGTNRLVIDGGGSAGSAIVNASTLRMGYNGAMSAFNAVIVTNGGRLILGAGGAYVGNGSGNIYTANSNRFEIASGGEVYTAGPVYVGCAGLPANYQGTQIGNSLAVRGLLDMGGAGLTAGYFVGGGYAGFVTGNKVIVDGGLVTNVGAVAISAGGGGGYPVCFGNSLNVINGGRLFSRGAAAVPSIGTSNSSVRVAGTGSLWDLGLAGLSLGMAIGTNNTLQIDDGGRVDNVGSLAVTASNSVALNGGTLGIASAIYNGGLFTVGDGAQAAVLKGLGGTCAFNAGLEVSANSTLTGAGLFSGAGSGVRLLSGGAINPGPAGAGSLTIGGSNLTLNAGAVVQCEITDLDQGPGVGWDVIQVASQLVVNGSGIVIRMDSLGAPAAHFDSGRDYNLRIVNYGSLTGYAPAAITVDAAAFANGGTWTVTNGANSLWLVYRGAAAPAAASFTWNAPNSGLWSDPANWAGGVAPASGGDPDWILAFPDTGVRYTASNNLGGSFVLKALRVSGTSPVTNVISGGLLVFTNTGAGIEYAAGATGSFIISNAVRLAADTAFSGSALAGTLALAGIVSNMGTIAKSGTWTLVLSNANNAILGPVTVDSPGGALRLDHVNALNGPGSVRVTNGLLAVSQGSSSYYFANRQDNRVGLVTGAGSSWSNNAATENKQSGFSQGASNVAFTVSGGVMTWAVRFHAFDNGSVSGFAMVTNGGQLKVNAPTHGVYVGYNSTNCSLLITGPDSVLGGSGGFYVGFGGNGNVLRLENMAVATNLNTLTVGTGATASNRLVGAGGSRLYTGIPTVGSAGGAFNSAILTGSNSLWVNSGNAAYIGTGAGSANNLLMVDDGAVATNFRLFVGSACHGNMLVVTNGGRLFGNGSYDQSLGSGPIASSNMAVVTDPGSVWNGAGRMLLVSTSVTSSWNRLVIANGGVVTNVSTVVLADGAGSSNNLILVDGGRLQAASVAFNNPLENGLRMEGDASVFLTTLSLSNANHSLSFNGGRLAVRNAWLSNGVPFIAGDGSQAALLDLPAGGGTNVFANGLVITNNATLAGSGYIVASTCTVYGTLSPGGPAVGLLTNNGALALMPGATTRTKITAATAPGAGWDHVVVTNGALALNGLLKPVLTGGYIPPKAARFLVMTNAGPGTVTGAFANGARATIYAENMTTRLGTFLIDIGTQGVVLADYQEWRPSGSLMILY